MRPPPLGKRFLSIWLPNWPIQRAQAENPQLAKVAFALSTRDSRRGMLVAAANLTARSQGIRANMRLSEATALTDLIVHEHDSQEDLETLCSLVEQAQQFSPLVGLEQLEKKMWAGKKLHQPENILLDVTGIGAHFGNEEQLLQQVSEWLFANGYFGCLAIAKTIGAAWAFSNYGLRRKEGGFNQERERSAPAAKQDDRPQNDSHSTDSQADSVPASRYAILSPDEESARIAALPVQALRLFPETVESLNRLGVFSIAQLELLPKSGLATRLGEHLISRWDQIVGNKVEPLITLHSLPDWALDESLEVPTDNRATLEALLERLSRELASRLAKRGAGALRVVCRLDIEEAKPVVLQLSLFRPTNAAEHLKFLLVGQFEQALQFCPLEPVWRISLQATLTAPLVYRQGDLFDGEAATNRNQIAQLVDMISNRLGRKQVLRARVQRESQPELAVRLTPITGRRSDGTPQDTVKKLSSRIARKRAGPAVDDPLRRPTQLLDQPTEIQINYNPPEDPQPSRKPSGHTHTAANSQEDGAFELAMAPDTLSYAGQTHVLQAVHGPERLESGWWRGPSARRDYYRVQTSKSAWFWIYRDLKSGKWFLHGLFD